ncbi:methyltransferase domain-containing protein, partial [Sulfurimonas sp. SAG-AH-194-C21]
YCSSAIELAKKKFKDDTNISFYTHNINDLESLNIEKFDLIISIGTLQSTNLEFNPLLMSIVQNQLKKDGAMILGFPNCRWIDGEMLYGARVKNYPFSEMGLLYKDVVFSKKYLQQKKYRVTITGKDYIFLTATSIRKD